MLINIRTIKTISIRLVLSMRGGDLADSILVKVVYFVLYRRDCSVEII